MHLLLIIGVIAFYSLVTFARQDQKQAPPKPIWEHKVVVETTTHRTVDLNKLGAEGWELVTVRSDEETMGNFHQTRVYYYLKRQR
jgi:hypothetical protein